MRVVTRRYNSIYQPPNPPNKNAPNPHREFYKTFGRPIAKNFLIAVITYQVLYWSWLKLESIEFKKDTDEEMRSLEGELRGLASNKSTS